MNRRCDMCEWWFQLECRRLPPSEWARELTHTDKTICTKLWPITGAGDWCGEFTPKETPKPKGWPSGPPPPLVKSVYDWPKECELEFGNYPEFEARIRADEREKVAAFLRQYPETALLERISKNMSLDV